MRNYLPLAIIGACLVALGVMGLIRLADRPEPVPLNVTNVKPAVNISNDGLLSEINQRRAENGAAAVSLDETLENASQTRAEGLCGVKLSHDNYLTELTASGYTWTIAGENLAEGYRTNYEVVKAWLESPLHRKNMIDPRYTETGIGIADCNGHYVIVNWFGTEQ